MASHSIVSYKERTVSALSYTIAILICLICYTAFQNEYIIL